MATGTITPEVTSAPAAAPETPVTQAPATPAVETTTPQTPATETKPEFSSGQDPREHLKAVLNFKEAHPEQKTDPETGKPVELEVKPEVPPVVDKTDEEKAVEEKAAADKLEAEKVAAEKTEASPLDKIGPLPAEQLAAVLTEDKALDQALTGKTIKLADGREVSLKDAMFETSRAAAEGSQFKELFPTIEDAKFAQEGAGHFFKLDAEFPAIKTSDDFSRFMMDTLVPLSYVLDEKGQPIPDPNIPGAYKTDGSVANFLKHSNDVEFAQINKIGELMGQRATSDDDKEFAEALTSAVKFLNDFRNNGYRKPGTASGEQTIPPEVKTELETLRARERETTEKQTQQQQKDHADFESKIVDGTNAQLTPTIEKALNMTALNDALKTKVAEEIWKRVTATVEKNPTFTQRREQMMSRRQMNDSVLQQRVAHNANYMKSILPKIIEDVTKEWGIQMVKENKERQNKIATQIADSKMEPKTGSTAALSQPAVLSDDQIHDKAVEMARAEHGRNANNSQILAKVLELKKLRQSA
jgi:hypothetical protein